MDGMESMRPRHRPKFSSASTMMGPRPFRRERRASGPSDQQQAAAAEGNGGQGRERIIPIQVERDETDSGAAASKQQTQQQAAQQQQTQPQPQQPQQQQQQQPRQQRPYVRRGTMDTPISTLQTEELQRDARARSAPPEAEPKATAARVPPLNVQAAAAASSPHKPNYFNSSPKPFSAQQRTFQTPSFGPQGQVPIPVQVERSGHQQQQQHQQQQPHQQQKQHHDQQPQHQQQQQQEEETKQPPPPPPKPKSPKERAMEAIACVQERVAELGAEVEVFTGQRGEKQHLYLDEMLTRELIKLDNVEANGDDEIRTTRKQTIMSIQKCLAQLEAKLSKSENTAAETEKAAEAEAPMETVEGQSAAEGAGPAVTGDAAAAEEVEMKSAGEAAQPGAAEAMDAAAEVVPQEPAGAPADAPAAPGETPTPAPAPSQDSTSAARS